MKYRATAHTKINEGSKKIPYDFFHLVEGHPTPPLITKKKKASVVTNVFTIADAIRILCEMFTRSMRQPHY